MRRRLGERRELAREVRKQLAGYLYWLAASGRDEAKAHRVLLAARAGLGRLVGLDAAASGIGGQDADGPLQIEQLASQLDEGASLLSEAGARVRAGTRMLHLLAALAGSWKAQADCAADPAAGALRACAAQLREAVAGAHAPMRSAVLGPAQEPAPGPDYETRHRIALARELTYAAGCPLRDRYGFAASDDDVAFAVDAVFREPDDARARFLIGSANGNQIELAMPGGTITDEAYELAIVRALRPLAEQRREAATRSL